MSKINSLLFNTRIDFETIERVNRVYETAMRTGERGVIDWAERAAEDARALGKLRDRDVKTLDRLEDTFNHDYYRDIINGLRAV